jgi:hypothetical protein
MAELRDSVQGFRAVRSGKWRVTFWKQKGDDWLHSHHVDPYVWDSEAEAEARANEFMSAGAGSSGWHPLYVAPDGTLCEFEELSTGAFEVCENPPGDFGLRFNQPGHHGAYINIVKGPATGTGHGPWGWDGNYDQPTIVPSIWHQGVWHGFLVKGYFRSC